MNLNTLQPTADIGNGVWGYRIIPDFPAPRVLGYVARINNTFMASSYADYGEQIKEEKKNPFEQIEESLSDHERITKFVKSDLYKARDDLIEVVTPRLKELMGDIDEEDDPEQSPIHVNSFKNFIRFLTNNINIVIPSFVVTYEGNIRALWRKSRKQHLAVEFHPDETVTYVIFAPNVDKPEKIMRSSGTISQRNLFRVAVSLGANKWISKK